MLPDDPDDPVIVPPTQLDIEPTQENHDPPLAPTQVEPTQVVPDSHVAPAHTPSVAPTQVDSTQVTQDHDVRVEDGDQAIA